MSGENGHTTPPAEGAPPAVETKEDATKKDTADTEMKEAPATAEAKAAAESGAEPAAAESTKESDKPAEGNTSFLPPHHTTSSRAFNTITFY